MKKVISILVFLAILMGTISCVFAENSIGDLEGPLLKIELQEEIDYLNKKYPDAKLDINDFIEFDYIMSQMNKQASAEYVAEIMKAQPEKVYYHEDDFGVDSTLLVFTAGVIVDCGRIFDSITYGGPYILYDGTVVYYNSLMGSSAHSLEYSANHEIDLTDYSGYVTWSGNVVTHDNSSQLFGNGQMIVSTGTTVYARAYYCQIPIGPGGIYLPTNPVYLYFDATTLVASVSF